jgi:hypothetical protein
MTAFGIRFSTGFSLTSGAWLVLLQAGLAMGQLSVLSKGNPAAEWRKAQIAQIEMQLTDKAAKAELKLELSAQQEWLKEYSTLKLGPQSTKANENASTKFDDPVIDPNKKAEAIRRKLFGRNARPTAADTEKLRSALDNAPNDIGLRQLQLHWLDQPQYREQYPAEISEAASRLRGLLESNNKLEPDKQKAAVAMTLYRQARALGYRLDLDSEKKRPLAEGEREKVDSQLVGAYTQLVNLVGPGHPEFALLEIRMLRRDNWFGRALQVLERNASTIEPRWYLEKRRDLLRDLGWKTPADQAQKMFAAAFPEEAKASE